MVSLLLNVAIFDWYCSRTLLPWNNRTWWVTMYCWYCTVVYHLFLTRQPLSQLSSIWLWRGRDWRCMGVTTPCRHYYKFMFYLQPRWPYMTWHFRVRMPPVRMVQFQLDHSLGYQNFLAHMTVGGMVDRPVGSHVFSYKAPRLMRRWLWII